LRGGGVEVRGGGVVVRDGGVDTPGCTLGVPARALERGRGLPVSGSA